MSPKKQGYKKAFLKFGFMSVIEKPQCVICFKVLTQESMKLSKLRQHFESCHEKLAGKSVDYFRQKSEFLGECVQNKTKQYWRCHIALPSALLWQKSLTQLVKNS